MTNVDCYLSNFNSSVILVLFGIYSDVKLLRSLRYRPFDFFSSKQNMVDGR